MGNKRLETFQNKVKAEKLAKQEKLEILKKTFWGVFGESIKKNSFVYSVLSSVIAIYAIILIWASSDSMTLFGVTAAQVGYVIIFIGFLMSVIEYKTGLLKAPDLPLGTTLIVLGILIIIDFHINPALIGYVFLGISALIIVFFLSLFSNGPGSASGIMLIPILIFVPLGLALIGCSLF